MAWERNAGGGLATGWPARWWRAGLGPALLSLGVLAVGCGGGANGTQGSVQASPVSGNTTQGAVVMEAASTGKPGQIQLSPEDLTGVLGQISPKEGDVCRQTTGPTKQVPEGYQVKWLYTCDELKALDRTIEERGLQKDPTARKVRQTVAQSVLIMTPPSQVKVADLVQIKKFGYTELGYNFKLTAMQLPQGATRLAALNRTAPPEATPIPSPIIRPIPDKVTIPGVRTIPQLVGRWRWHTWRTGVASVAARLQGQNGSVPARSRLKVAVLDTGIQQVVPGVMRDRGWSFDRSGHWLQDLSGHGTGVASLIQESAAGTADLMSVQVLDGQGRGTVDSVARGIVNAVNLGAQVINLSLGFPRCVVPDGKLPEALQDALSYASVAKVPVVASAGNSCGKASRGCDLFFPAGARVPGVIAVGGLNPYGTPSSQGAGAGSVAAPTEFICQETGSRDTGPTGLQRLSGTSFGPPQLIGALSLLLSTQNSSSPDKVMQVVGYLVDSPDRRLDACAAYQKLFPQEKACSPWSLDAPDWRGESCGSAPGYTDVCSASPRGQAACDFSGRDETTLVYRSQAVSAATPVDGRGTAVWCKGVSSAPSAPVCTSCDYSCLESGTSRYAVSLRLTPNAGFFRDYQIKVRSNGQDYYLPLGDLPGLDAGVAVSASGSIVPPLPAKPTEAWLMARDKVSNTLYTGVPLRVSCQ